MATITVRNLDDDIKELLRISAAKNGHSMEEEARMILKQALVKKPPRYGLGTRIHQHFAELGGVELEIPPRDKTPPRIVTFDDDDDQV
ncbi:FitA-like ribbon-helix-helix domain-containing protein [Serratia sp. TSA_198.1]|jgi:plasmid stability protein|uniref:FitA-like ribbon-helix-helix domain-containing protein n=1 Tax=Serratia TaxID=613 RepID=UPI003DA22FEE